MKRGAFLQPLLLALMPAMAANVASAQTFGEAVELARNTEPAYLGARANATAAQQRSRVAFAGLLPQVSATASTNTNRRDYTTKTEPFVPQSIDYYNSNNAQLNLTQPLYRPSNLAALRQSEAAVTQADYQVAAAEQELLVRLVAAWFDVMSARDGVLFTTRQAATSRQQWEILRRGVALGTAAAPAMEEAHARYEQALAEQSAAQMELHVRTAALEQIIGPAPAFNPPFLAARPPRLTPERDTLPGWLHRTQGSPQVNAAYFALSAAEEEIRKQRAGYGPTLDVVTTYGRNSQQVGGFPGQGGYDIKLGTIGLQLSVPLFSGGAQDARVEEAVAGREKARQELIATQRASRLAAQQAWFGWQAASARRAAALQASRAALLALQTAAAGIAAGVKTELDRLQARQLAEGARRDLSKAHYDLAVTYVRLRAACGELDDEDLRALEAMLGGMEADLHELLQVSSLPGLPAAGPNGPGRPFRADQARP
jgi:outer membrane protein